MLHRKAGGNEVSVGGVQARLSDRAGAGCSTTTEHTAAGRIETRGAAVRPHYGCLAEAAEIEKVSHVFHPSARWSASNSL